MRDFTAAGSELDHVQGIEGKLRQFRQSPGQGRLAPAGIPEDGYLLHVSLPKGLNEPKLSSAAQPSFFLLFRNLGFDELCQKNERLLPAEIASLLSCSTLGGLR